MTVLLLLLLHPLEVFYLPQTEPHGLDLCQDLQLQLVYDAFILGEEFDITAIPLCVLWGVHHCNQVSCLENIQNKGHHSWLMKLRENRRHLLG